MLTTESVASAVMAEKIQRQGQQIAQLQSELRQARATSIEAVLGQLRLRGAVLLFVGSEVDGLGDQLAREFGSEVANAVAHHLFILDAAPASHEAKNALREAINQGLSRW